MDVVVDHPRCVLEVQALGEDVCGNEDADLRVAFLRKRRRGEAVVVGREALDDVSAVARGGAVDLGDAVDAGLVELALQVAGGVGELGEDEDLLVGKFFRFEQSAELLELVVVLWARTSWPRP